MRSAFILATAGAACLLMLPNRASVPLIVWNVSPSAPIGLYLIVRASPRLGDLALVRLSQGHAKVAIDRGYVPRSGLLLKTVTAGPGTRTCRFGRRVLIAPDIVLRVLLLDSFGRPLPRWTGCRRLRADEMMLIGRDARSFDSRYFGPIAADRVVGRAIVIWVVPTRRS